jgi:hypothetical protein
VYVNPLASASDVALVPRERPTHLPDDARLKVHVGLGLADVVVGLLALQLERLERVVVHLEHLPARTARK